MLVLFNVGLYTTLVYLAQGLGSVLIAVDIYFGRPTCTDHSKT